MASSPGHIRQGSGCTKPLGEIAHTHGLGHAQESRSTGHDSHDQIHAFAQHDGASIVS
jgi:hypothetical protein